MRFSGIYKILIELRDLWYANSLQLMDTFEAKNVNSAFRNRRDRGVLDSLIKCSACYLTKGVHYLCVPTEFCMYAEIDETNVE